MFYDLVTVNTPFVQNTAVRVPPFFNRGGLVAVAAPSSSTSPSVHDAVGAARRPGAARRHPVRPRPAADDEVEHQLPARDLPRRVSKSDTPASRGKNLVPPDLQQRPRGAGDVDGRLFVAASTPLVSRLWTHALPRQRRHSDYKGLTVGLTRRLRRPQAQMSYTFSKSEDDGAAALGGNDFTIEAPGRAICLPRIAGCRRSTSGIRSWPRQLPAAVRRNGDRGSWRRWPKAGTFDADPPAQRLSVLGILGRGHRPAGPGLGAGISRLRPGASANPVLGNVDHWFDPTAFVLPATGFIGTLQRNSIIGPDSRTVDLLAGKSVSIGRSELQFRFECFNLLNRANFGTPQQNVFNTNGTIREDAGRITTTSTSARQIQLGVKFVW